MRPLLLKILQFFFTSEQPTANELIAYGAEQERKRRIAQATVYVSVCEIHRDRPFDYVGNGFYRCTDCQRFAGGPHTDPLQQLPPRPVQKSLAPSQQRLMHLYNHADGKSTHSRILNAITQKQLAEWKAAKLEQEKEGQK